MALAIRWLSICSPYILCAPVWPHTHNTFIFLLRTCVHGRLEVPRNYLPTSTLMRWGAAPWPRNGYRCINNPAPSPFLGNNSEAHVWHWFPEFPSWCVFQMPKWQLVWRHRLRCLSALPWLICPLSSQSPGLGSVRNYFLVSLCQDLLLVNSNGDRDKRVKAHDEMMCPVL